MPSAEVITIGTEILLGEIVDTNARYLAVRLRENGIDLYRKTTVGDNSQRIAQAIQEALNRCDIVITTGGLGPTVDDPTRDAVALSVGVKTEFRPELWDQIQARFQRYNRQPTENNRRQAYIPSGAIAIENPVGTAPSFVYEIESKCIISLPGVPSEMMYLLDKAIVPYLVHRYQINTVIKTRTLHTAGVGESQIDDLISEFEALSNPTVGLAAHSGQVDIRIVAKASSQEQADQMIRIIEDQIRSRLGRWIYGIDQETLEASALDALESRGWTLTVVESGTDGELARRLATTQNPRFRGGEIILDRPSPEALVELALQFSQTQKADVDLAITVHPGSERQDVYVVLATPIDIQKIHRPYGGPPDYAPRWAVHHGLDLVRKLRKEEE